MYYHCLRLIMNIQSSKNDKWNNRANIGLYAMVLIVNIKLQTAKLWHTLYSVYLDRLLAAALVLICVSIIYLLLLVCVC